MDYNMVCEIETAHANANHEISKVSGTLPLKPLADNRLVMTFFWADNFDLNLETSSGHGAINSTHMIAFEEESEFTIHGGERVQLERTRKRSLHLHTEEPSDIQVNPKKEPPIFNTFITNESLMKGNPSENLFLTWMILRKLNFKDQTISSYFAWKMKLRSIAVTGTIKKTLMTYLPPINSKVTDFNTINQYLMYMQKLANEANMPYVNVSLDVGAAINAFKFVWNFPVRFNNVVIHLGDFHFIKENFGVIGKLIAGSGFEDVVFQSGVCSMGSLNGVLAGSHYNRAWIVHASFSEALEKLLFERFLEEKNFVISTSFYHFDQISNCCDLIEHATELYAHYHAFKDDMRKGMFGKTAQFWVQLYLDLIECQRRAHLAVQENDFNSRYAAWKQFLPMYFALNKPNYARYASYYVGVLENIEVLYPGLNELLDNNGFSVQAQERYPLRTAIDQRGEQMFNRDAKAAGGIKSFANDSKSVLKWTLNRSEQAKNTAELLHMANIQTPGNIYKSLRPSQILKSESFCTRIVTV